MEALIDLALIWGGVLIAVYLACEAYPVDTGALLLGGGCGVRQPRRVA